MVQVWEWCSCHTYVVIAEFFFFFIQHTVSYSLKKKKDWLKYDHCEYLNNAKLAVPYSTLRGITRAV